MCHRLGEKKECCRDEAPRMIHVYYSPGSGACRMVLMVAAALDIEVIPHELDLGADEQMSAEFLKINPQHTVPTIVDEDFTLTEARAIARYLVNRYSEDSNLYPFDPQERALVDARLDFDLGTLNPCFAQYFYPKILNGGTIPSEVSLKKLQDALHTLDGLLQEHSYAAGSHMTLADLALVATVSTIDAAEVDLEPYPNILRWYDLVRDNAAGYNKYNEKGLRELKKVVNEAKKAKLQKEEAIKAKHEEEEAIKAKAQEYEAKKAKAQSQYQSKIKKEKKSNEDVTVKPSQTPQKKQLQLPEALPETEEVDDVLKPRLLLSTKSEKFFHSEGSLHQKPMRSTQIHSVEQDLLASSSRMIKTKTSESKTKTSESKTKTSENKLTKRTDCNCLDEKSNEKKPQENQPTAGVSKANLRSEDSQAQFF